MSDHEYLGKLTELISSQDYLKDVPLDAVGLSSTRDELGITSLSVIMLVANYMERVGGADQAFDPDWVHRLNDVGGIIQVMRLIDTGRPS